MRRRLKATTNGPGAAAAADAWLQMCDAIDAAFPVEDCAARIEASLRQAAAIVKEAIIKTAAKQGLSAAVTDELTAGIDDWLARKLWVLEDAVYEEKRSRRMARELGRIRILGHGYITTGESNWLTHPEMRRHNLLHEVITSPWGG